MANMYQDFEGALSAVVATASKAATLAGLAGPEVLSAGLGLAGVMTPEAAARIRAANLPFRRVAVDSDAYIACLGAHGGENGGILIAGTGSAALALIGGTRHMIGGWGFALGDDGSASQLGRRALRLVALAMDGLVPASPLLNELREHFESDHGRLSAWARNALPRDYAAFAPAIFAAAGRGDLHGRALVEECAGFIATMGRALLAKGAGRLSLVGGMAAAVEPHIPSDVSARFVPPRADPVDGAIMMARLAAGLEALW
jgi:glucosamine kinase